MVAVSNSQKFNCLCLPSARIKGMCPTLGINWTLDMSCWQPCGYLAERLLSSPAEVRESLFKTFQVTAKTVLDTVTITLDCRKDV